MILIKVCFSSGNSCKMFTVLTVLFLSWKFMCSVGIHGLLVKHSLFRWLKIAPKDPCQVQACSSVVDPIPTKFIFDYLGTLLNPFLMWSAAAFSNTVPKPWDVLSLGLCKSQNVNQTFSRITAWSQTCHILPNILNGFLQTSLSTLWHIIIC